MALKIQERTGLTGSGVAKESLMGGQHAELLSAVVI